MTGSSFIRVTHRKLVGFACTYYYRIRELDAGYGLDNKHRTTQAQSLYRCWLSCKGAFPPPLTQDDWEKEVWKEVCYRTEVHPSPNLLRQDEEACLVFCYIWHSFTWIFSLNAVAWSSSTT